MENYSTSLDNAFHALADPTRRAVLARLATGSAPVGELAEPFAMGLPSFMKHLKVLEDSGLIGSTKQGRVRTCFVKLDRLAATEAWLSEQRRL
jgi:DNA-binding transcriptional ArsR family regulator